MSQQQFDYGTPSQSSWYKSKSLRRAVLYLAAVVLCYVLSYAVLSKFGRYEPSSLNIRGVDWYQWGPAGFVHNYRRRDVLFYAFLPLWLADREYWHTDNEAWRGRYPRHDPKNIGELERAWKR